MAQPLPQRKFWVDPAFPPPQQSSTTTKSTTAMLTVGKGRLAANLGGLRPTSADAHPVIIRVKLCGNCQDDVGPMARPSGVQQHNHMYTPPPHRSSHIAWCIVLDQCDIVSHRGSGTCGHLSHGAPPHLPGAPPWSPALSSTAPMRSVLRYSSTSGSTSHVRARRSQNCASADPRPPQGFSREAPVKVRRLSSVSSHPPAATPMSRA